MNNELKIALASLYKKKGKPALSEKEFVFSASMDLRWFKPKEAQRFLDVALASELAKVEEDLIHLTFDHKEIKIPKGFKPSEDVLKQVPVAKKGLFVEIVEHIAANSEKDTQDIIALANAKQENMNIYSTVAAILVGNEMEVDMSGFVAKVEEEMKGKLDS